MNDKQDTYNVVMDNLTYIEDITVSSGDIGISDSTHTIKIDEDFLNDSGSEYTFNINTDVDFETSMPSLHKIDNMCEHYPALKIAYEKFKTIYKLVNQDYRGNHEDNEYPF